MDFYQKRNGALLKPDVLVELTRFVNMDLHEKMHEKPYTNYVHQQGTVSGSLEPPINDFSKRVLKRNKAYRFYNINTTKFRKKFHIFPHSVNMLKIPTIFPRFGHCIKYYVWNYYGRKLFHTLVTV